LFFDELVVQGVVEALRKGVGCFEAAIVGFGGIELGGGTPVKFTLYFTRPTKFFYPVE
jgi:hypothetical protein